MRAYYMNYSIHILHVKNIIILNSFSITLIKLLIANNTLIQVWIELIKVDGRWQFHDASPMPNVCWINMRGRSTCPGWCSQQYRYILPKWREHRFISLFVRVRSKVAHIQLPQERDIDIWMLPQSECNSWYFVRFSLIKTKYLLMQTCTLLEPREQL